MHLNPFFASQLGYSCPVAVHPCLVAAHPYLLPLSADFSCPPSIGTQDSPITTATQYLQLAFLAYPQCL